MIEAGKRDVTVSSLFRISRALKVSMNEIFLFDDLDKFKFDIEELYKWGYFPIQKWSKMLFRISSLITSPVISSRESNADLTSI